MGKFSIEGPNTREAKAVRRFLFWIIFNWSILMPHLDSAFASGHRNIRRNHEQMKLANATRQVPALPLAILHYALVCHFEKPTMEVWVPNTNPSFFLGFRVINLLSKPATR